MGEWTAVPRPPAAAAGADAETLPPRLPPSRCALPPSLLLLSPAATRAHPLCCSPSSTATACARTCGGGRAAGGGAGRARQGGVSACTAPQRRRLGCPRCRAQPEPPTCAHHGFPCPLPTPPTAGGDCHPRPRILAALGARARPAARAGGAVRAPAGGWRRGVQGELGGGPAARQGWCAAARAPPDGGRGTRAA